MGTILKAEHHWDGDGSFGCSLEGLPSCVEDEVSYVFDLLLNQECVFLAELLKRRGIKTEKLKNLLNSYADLVEKAKQMMAEVIERETVRGEVLNKAANSSEAFNGIYIEKYFIEKLENILKKKD